MVQDQREETTGGEDAILGGPLVSVVCPIFNNEHQVTNAINSILRQTFEDFELILVNDGSTDKTEEAIKKFQDPRIRYFRRPHTGVVGARNFGNSMAQGTFIVVQDADDLAMPDRIEKIVTAFKRHEADIIYHSLYVNVWNAQYACMERYYKRAEPVDRARILTEQYLPGVMAHKKWIWEQRPYREETRWASDWQIWLDWIFSGFKARYIDEGLYEYVRHINSSSGRFEREGKRAKSIQALREIILEEYGKKLH